MPAQTSSEFVNGLIAALRDVTIALHPQLRIRAADALEALLQEQENWAEGGAAEFLRELRAAGWKPDQTAPADRK